MPYKDPAKRAEATRRWRERNPEHGREAYRRDPIRACRRLEEWARKNPERRKTTNALSHIKRRYGLTGGDVARMLHAQGGSCGICERVLTNEYHIDHDHSTGAVRGLLCPHCNRGLGLMQDDENVLLAAVEYLKRSRCINTPKSRSRKLA